MTRSQPPTPPPPPPPSQLGYASPGSAYQPPFFSWRLAVPFWVFLVAATLFMWLVVPKFEQIFKDFKTELPMVTKLVLGISRTLTGTYLWLLTLPLLAVTPIAVQLLIILGVRDAAQYRRRQRLAMWLMFLVAGLGIAMVFIAMFAPMISLMQSISGGSSKK